MKNLLRKAGFTIGSGLGLLGLLSQSGCETTGMGGVARANYAMTGNPAWLGLASIYDAEDQERIRKDEQEARLREAQASRPQVNINNNTPQAHIPTQADYNLNFTQEWVNPNNPRDLRVKLKEGFVEHNGKVTVAYGYVFRYPDWFEGGVEPAEREIHLFEGWTDFDNDQRVEFGELYGERSMFYKGMYIAIVFRWDGSLPPVGEGDEFTLRLCNEEGQKVIDLARRDINQSYRYPILLRKNEIVLRYALETENLSPGNYIVKGLVDDKVMSSKEFRVVSR